MGKLFEQKMIQEKGQTKYLSEITNATQLHPPNPIMGSILYVYYLFIFSLMNRNCTHDMYNSLTKMLYFIVISTDYTIERMIWALGR